MRPRLLVLLPPSFFLSCPEVGITVNAVWGVLGLVGGLASITVLTECAARLCDCEGVLFIAAEELTARVLVNVTVTTNCSPAKKDD